MLPPALLLLLPACSGGSPTPEERGEQATYVGSQPQETSHPARDGRPADPCDLLQRRKLARVLGERVARPEPLVGRGQTGEVPYGLDGCAVDTGPVKAPELQGQLHVALLTTPDGALLPASDLDRIEAASAAEGDVVPFPHDEVRRLGDAAFFASGSAGEKLFVRAGRLTLLVSGEDGERGQWSRRQLVRVGRMAVERLDEAPTRRRR